MRNWNMVAFTTGVDDIDIEIERVPHARHRLEVRAVGMIQSIREGPFIAHNLMVSHCEFLSKVNQEQTLKLWRIFPCGGSLNPFGDSLALAMWLILVAYDLSAIPMACLCQVMVINIVNCSLLSLLLVFLVLWAYLVTSNKKKFKRHWFIAETTANKFQGLQNYFIDIDSDRADALHLLNQSKRKQIIQHLNLKRGSSLVLMLCTESYWRNRVILPIISLSVTAVLALAGVLVHLEMMRQSYLHWNHV